MTNYTFPSSLWKLATVNMQLKAMSASRQASAFNQTAQSDGPTVELWMATVTITPMEEDDWRDLGALIRKLRGRRNKIRLFDPSRTLRGAGPGPTLNIDADVVAGATSLTVNGLTASQAVGLAADDVFAVGENLYAVSDDVASDSDGKATISFLPPARTGFADGDPVNISSPTGLFLLVDGGEGLTVLPGRISQPLTLSFVEAPDLE